MCVFTQACSKYPEIKKFAISFQYLKENVKVEVDFLAADKLLQIFQRFFQIDTIILDVWSSMPKLPKNNKFPIPLQYLTIEVSDEVDFLHAKGLEKFPTNQ